MLFLSDIPIHEKKQIQNNSGDNILLKFDAKGNWKNRIS
jgi:hypothetical protein